MYKLPASIILFFLLLPSIVISQEASRYFPLVQGNTWVYHHKHVVEEGSVYKQAEYEENIVKVDTVAVKVHGTISELGKTYAVLELKGEEWRYFRIEGNQAYKGYSLNNMAGDDFKERKVFDFTPSISEEEYNMTPDGYYSPRTVETMSLPFGEVTGYYCKIGYGFEGLHFAEHMFFVDSVGPAYMYFFDGWSIPPVKNYYYLMTCDVQQDPVAIQEINTRQPFLLFPATPNPFNPTVTLSYTLPQSEYVLLSIYNLQGQLVETLVNQYQSEGNHAITWNATGHASGLYFYRVEAAKRVETGKMLLMK